MSDIVEVEGDTPDTAANTNGEGAEASLLLQSPSVESPMNSGSEYEEISLITSSESGYEEDGLAQVHSSPTSPAMPAPPVEDNTQSPARTMNLQNSEDIYAVIDKSRSSPAKTLKKEDEEILPLGWKKCYDEDGAYYWHVRTGTIQRDRPEASDGDPEDISSPADHLKSMESSLINLADQTIKSLSMNNSSAHTSSVGPEQALRFSVHSIGWVPLTEADLQGQEISCRSINRCILDLTQGKTNDGMAQFAEGKELCMEIDGKELCLVDPVSTTVLSVQPIHTIRVWGVGSQNSCDFAYVARDSLTKIHKCHVFRCEVPAKQIANTLKEICSRLAKERKARSPTTTTQDKTKRDELNALQLIAEKGKVVLPSPMDGPSKTKKCHYVGTVPVHKPSGMDVINSAIEKLANTTDKSEWLFVNVMVSPAAVKVSGVQDSSIIKLDTRLRFLTFFGISAHDVKFMGMIIHTAEDEFVAHVFHCEPSAGGLCKIIEAACKLRYQKLLDSMPEGSVPEGKPSPTTTGNKVPHLPLQPPAETVYSVLHDVHL